MKHLYKVLLFLLLFPFFYGCLEDPNGPEGILNARIPEIKIDTITDKTATSFNVSVEITEKNGAPITRYGFIVKEQDSETEREIEVGSDNKTTTFTHTIDNLREDTKYVIQAFAVNSAGKGVSSTYLVSTEDGLGIVSTMIPDESEIWATKAILGGKIMDPGEGEILERGVFLATDKAMAESDKVTFSVSADPFSEEVTGLTPSTQYYVKAFVRNTFGTFEGTVETFITTSGKPLLAEFMSIEPDFTFATFTAEILEAGDSPIINRGFCWTTDATENLNKDEHETILVELTDDGVGIFTGQLTGLVSKTRYLVRAFAENDFGVTYSEETLSFFPKSMVPTVTTLEVEEVEGGYATIGMVLEDLGNTPVTSMGILYSNQTKYPELTNSSDSVVYEGEEPIAPGLEFKKRVPLNGSDLYHMRAYAINESGIEYGEVVTVTTPSIFTSKATFSPNALYATGFTSPDNYAFLLGGFLGGEQFSTLRGYNPESNSWTSYTPFPFPIKGTTASVLGNDTFFVIGGIDENNQVLDSFYAYDSRRSLWTKQKEDGYDLPEPLFDAVSFVEDKVVYVIGGKKQDDSYSNKMYSCSYGSSIGWVELTTFNGNISQGVVFRYEEKVYIGLGENSSTLWNSNDNYTSWSTVTTAPGNIGIINTGVVSGDSFFGINRDGCIWEYELKENAWYQRGTLAGSGTLYFHMYGLNNEIYILGQSNTNWNTFVVYDPAWDPVGRRTDDE